MKAKYILAAITTLVIFGCSKENNGDADTNNADTNNSVITTLDGKTVRLSRYIYTSYGYNLEGRITNIGEIFFDYTNNEIHYSDLPIFGTFKTNSNGYLTEILLKEENESSTYEAKETFSYDKSGYLTNYASSYIRSYSDDSKIIVSKDISGTITWTNGSIASLTLNTSFRESEGDKIVNINEGTATVTFTSYSRNLVGQHAGADVSESGLADIYVAGMLGKAPSNHPTKVNISTSSTSNGEFYSDNQSISIEYLYGTDGTITKESFTLDDGYNFEHEYAYQEFTPTTKGLDFSLESTDDEASCTNPRSILKDFHLQLICPDRYSK